MDTLRTGTKPLPLAVHVRLMKYEVDSSFLMDFESKNDEESRVTIPPSNQEGVVYIIKKNGRIQAVAGEEELEPCLEANPGIETLSRLEWNEKGCFLSDPGDYRAASSSESCYAVISNKLSRKLHGRYDSGWPMEHVIKEGDKIQFGRMTLIVRYLAHSPVNSISYIQDLISQGNEEHMASTCRGSNPEHDEAVGESEGLDTTNEVSDETSSTVLYVNRDSGVDACNTSEANVKSDNHEKLESPSEQMTCRICLEDESTGPLVAPCQCKGSMKYVHLSCVRTWVHGRLKVNDENGNPHLSYFLRNLKCELCNVNYPPYVEVGTVVTEFLGIEEPAHPYAVLEPENSTNTGLHLVSVAKGPVEIGRGSNTVVTLPDISVSRSHARLEYKDGQFVIQDRGSKFGTLLRINPKFRIALDTRSPIILKLGTDILCVSLKPIRPFGSLCCFPFKMNAVRVT